MVGERARDSKHEFVDEILNESDIEQIQYMVGERVSSEIQYIEQIQYIHRSLSLK